MNYRNSARGKQVRGQGDETAASPSAAGKKRMAGQRVARSAPSAPRKQVFPQIQPADLPADIVLTRLRALRLRINGGGPWQSICPSHPDLVPSLSLTETADGVLLIKCFGGCHTEEVLAALDLTFRNLYPSLIAFQSSKRRPGGKVSFRGGKHDDKVAIPSPEHCARFQQLLQKWQAPLTRIKELAKHLGLTFESLQALLVGYNPKENCWVFPEMDAQGRVVGLVRRYRDGRKVAIAGGLRGLTIPKYSQPLPPGALFLAEGASDTAALYSVGALAIGRSNATASLTEQNWLFRFLQCHRDWHEGRQIVVVGDRDPSKAGARGAHSLSSFLGCALQKPQQVSSALPAKGFKDVREQIAADEWGKGLICQNQLET